MATTILQTLTSSLVWNFFIAIAVYSLVINTIFGHKTYWRSASPWKGIIRFCKKTYRFLTTGSTRRAQRPTPTALPSASKPKRLSLLENLDDNLYIYILSFLLPSDVIRITRASKNTRSICESPQVWFLFQEQAYRELEKRTSLKAAMVREKFLTAELREIFDNQSARGKYFMSHFVIIRMLLRNEDKKHSSDQNNNNRTLSGADDEKICRLLVEGDVYDLTQFQWEHPGGEYILGEWRGKDATKQFHIANHSNFALELSKNYKLWSTKKWIGKKCYAKFNRQLYAALVLGKTMSNVDSSSSAGGSSS